jgi:hypothetical protein
MPEEINLQLLVGRVTPRPSLGQMVRTPGPGLCADQLEALAKTI